MYNGGKYVLVKYKTRETQRMLISVGLRVMLRRPDGTHRRHEEVVAVSGHLSCGGDRTDRPAGLARSHADDGEYCHFPFHLHFTIASGEK